MKNEKQKAPYEKNVAIFSLKKIKCNFLMYHFLYASYYFAGTVVQSKSI